MVKEGTCLDFVIASKVIFFLRKDTRMPSVEGGDSKREVQGFAVNGHKQEFFSQEHPDYKYRPKRQSSKSSFSPTFVHPYNKDHFRKSVVVSVPSGAYITEPRYALNPGVVEDYSRRNSDTDDEMESYPKNGTPGSDSERRAGSSEHQPREAHVHEENGNSSGYSHSEGPGRRTQTLATGCTAVVGNPAEVFRAQQNLVQDACFIYETGNKPVVVTFAKYNLTLRLEPEKLAASLLPILHSWI